MLLCLFLRPFLARCVALRSSMIAAIWRFAQTDAFRAVLPHVGGLSMFFEYRILLPVCPVVLLCLPLFSLYAMRCAATVGQRHHVFSSQFLHIHLDKTKVFSRVNVPLAFAMGRSRC